MSAPAVEIVPAHWRDLGQLVAMEAEAHPHDGWTEATWWAELAAPRREYVVAVDAASTGAAVPGTRRVLAYAGLDHGGSTADVMTVTVDPTARGAGLGRRVMDHLVRRARQEGAEALLLEVRSDNVAALAMYRRLGFTELTVRRGYYRGPDGPVDAHVLRLLLDQVAEPAPAPHDPTPHDPTHRLEVSAR